MQDRYIRFFPVLCIVIVLGGFPQHVATPWAQDPDPVLLAAGDIATCGAGDEATAALLDGIPGTVVTLGDHAYNDGSLAQFQDCYESS